MTDLLDNAYLDVLCEWQSATTRDAGTRAMVLCERAHRLERKRQAPSDDAPLLAREAYALWREASELVPELQRPRLALMRYATSELLTPEEREALFAHLRSACPREERVDLCMLDGERALGKGDGRGARRAFEEVLELVPEHRGALARLRQLARSQDDHAEANTWVMRHAHKTTDNRLRAALAFEAGRIEETVVGAPSGAVAHYRTGLAAAPHDGLLMEAACRALTSAEEWHMAAQARDEQAHALQPGTRQRWAVYEAARILGRRLASHDQALRTLKLAMSARPEMRLLRLGRELGLDAGAEDLTEACRALVEHAPEGTEKAHYLWLLSEELGEGPEAVECLRKALALDPAYATAALALELAYCRADSEEELVALLSHRGQAEKAPGLLSYAGRLADVRLLDKRQAEELYRSALRMLDIAEGLLGPFGPADALLEIYEDQGRHEEGIELLDWLLEQPVSASERVALRGRLADMHLHAGSAQCRTTWSALVELQPNDSFVTLVVGGILQRAEAWDDLLTLRRAELERIADSEPMGAEAVRTELASILERQLGRTDEALALLQEGMATAPTYWLHRVHAGRLLIEHGRDADLAALYQRQLASPLSAHERRRLLANLGQVLEFQLGDHHQAAATYEQLVDEGGSDPAALEGLLRIGDAVGRPDLATDACRRLAEQEGDPRYRSVLFYQRGQRLERIHHDAEGALTAYRAAWESDRESVAAGLAWERLSMRLGRKDELRAYLSDRLTQAPDSPDAIEWLERLVLVAGTDGEGRAIEQLLTRSPNHLGALVRLMRRVSTRGNASSLGEVLRALAMATPAGDVQVAFRHAQILLGFVSDTFTPEPEVVWELVEARHSDPTLLLRLLASLPHAPTRTELQKVYGALARGAFSPLEQATYLTSLGRALADDGQYDRATKALEQTLKIRPDYVPAIKMIRILAADVGENARFAEAVELEAEAAVDQGQAIKHLLHAADIRRRQLGHISGAAAALEKILALEPLHEEAFDRLHDLYTTQGMFPELYAILCRRAESLSDISARCKVYLRAAELAYGRLHDLDRAIAAHRAVLANDPQFLRSYRIIAEIHMERENWKEAAEALRGVINLAKDKKLLGRTWLQLAEVFDERLGDLQAAVRALRHALEYAPESTDALQQLASLYVRLGQFEEAVATLKVWSQAERVPLARKDVLLRLARLLLERFRDFDGAEEAISTIREIDPRDAGPTKELADYYGKLKNNQRRTAFLQQSFEEYRDRFKANISRPDPLHALFQISGWLDAPDRRFVLASILSFVGAADEPEVEAYQAGIKEAAGRRVPTAQIPSKRTAGIFASGLHVNILHMLRQAGPHVARFSQRSLKQLGVSRKHKLGPGARPLALMQPFAEVFGIELPDVFLVPEREELMAFVGGDEPAFVLSERDLEPKRFPETLARTAIGCAGLSMGLAPYATVDVNVFQQLVYGIASAVVPNRRFGQPVNADSIETIARAIPKKVSDLLTGYVLEIASSLDDQLLRQQHEAIIASTMRLGLLTLHDPRPGLTVIARDGDAGLFDVVAVMKDALVFLTSDHYTDLRKAVGVAASP